MGDNSGSDEAINQGKPVPAFGIAQAERELEAVFDRGEVSPKDQESDIGAGFGFLALKGDAHEGTEFRKGKKGGIDEKSFHKDCKVVEKQINGIPKSWLKRSVTTLEKTL